MEGKLIAKEILLYKDMRVAEILETVMHTGVAVAVIGSIPTY